MAKIKGQTEWGWKIAAYLFLAGMGGGAYTFGAVGDFLGYTEIAKIGISMGFPLVLVGCLFLILDLGMKWRFLRAFMNPGTSWIARGTFIISIFMILGAVHTGAWIWPFSWLDDAIFLRRAIEVINLVFAFLTMIYTGILLGASRAIPMWSTAMLPVLFLVSALSTGTMSIMLVSSLINSITGSPHNGADLLAWIDSILIILEFIVLYLYFQATHRTTESRASIEQIMRGELVMQFWAGVVSFGLFIPLIFELFFIFSSQQVSRPTQLLIALFVSIPGLIGGLLLRKVVLALGIKTPLRAAGIDFVFPVSR